MTHHPSILRTTKLLLAAVVVAVSVTSAAAASSEEQQCLGKDPMLSVATFLDMDLDYETADRICCHNHRYAEPRGYHIYPEVDFYNRLDPNTEHVFYDSVCGIPLFVAPRGRTFDEFVAESILHGWPSFRPEELVSENVIIHENGRMESKCKTHLGHNLPKDGVDRYCIDLVCMAGTPSTMVDAASNNETMSISNADAEEIDMEQESLEEILEDELLLGDDIISASDFDASSYESSALQRSGKEPKNKFLVAVAIAIPVLLTIGGLYLVRRWYLAKQNDPSEKPKTLDDPEDPTKEQEQPPSVA